MCRRRGLSHLSSPGFDVAARVLLFVGATVLLLASLGGLESGPWGKGEFPSLAASVITEAPASRSFHAMAYDAESDRIILYGGMPGPKGDTWAFDLNSNTWTNQAPAKTPPVLTTHTMAYDAKSDLVVLFGGVTLAGGGFVELNETWVYDYNDNSWTNMTPSFSPAPRLGHRMAYDIASDRVILVGGHTQTTSPVTVYFDTWAYDSSSNTWSQQSPSLNPVANYNVLAYDSESDRVISFGGQIGADVFGDQTWTYEYDNDSWAAKSPTSKPSPRWMHAGAYDAGSDRLVMFGGAADLFQADRNSETWAYDLNADGWVEMQPAVSPRPRRAHQMAYDSESDRVVLFGGHATNDTWAYNVDTDIWTPLTLPSRPLDLRASTVDLQIDLTWGPPSQVGGAPIINYRVYRGASADPPSLIEELGNSRAYTDTNVTLGVTYRYRVSAVTAAGEGPQSDEETATPSDTTNPTIAITFVDPAVGFLMALVNGTAADNVALERVELSTDRTSWQLANGTSSWSGLVALECGDNTIFARATDTSGNMAEADGLQSLHLDCPEPPPILILGIVSAVGASVAIVFLVRRRRNRG